MEIRTGKYANFILTVIAALLVGILFQISLGMVADAQAQPVNDERARRQAVVNSVSDPAVAQGLQAIASAIREVADSLREVARGNERIAGAVRDLELSPDITVRNETAP